MPQNPKNYKLDEHDHLRELWEVGALSLSGGQGLGVKIRTDSFKEAQRLAAGLHLYRRAMETQRLESGEGWHRDVKIRPTPEGVEFFRSEGLNFRIEDPSTGKVMSVDEAYDEYMPDEIP